MSFTWEKEAIERDIHFIVLSYGKSEGVVFCPQSIDKPFRIGGGYDGNWPVQVNAELALAYAKNDLPDTLREQLIWFYPFLEKLIQQVDFSLDELGIKERHLTTLSEPEWPW